MRKQTVSKGRYILTKKDIIILGVLVLLIAGVSAWLCMPHERTYGGKNPTVNRYLIQHNPDFARGEALGLSIGSSGTTSTERIEAYRAALSSSQDDTQEGQIMYKMGMAYVQEGDFQSAIDVLERVADDTSYPTYERAYAVQELVTLHNTNPTDTRIVTQTFAQAPYAAMYNPSDLSLSYRAVCEYAGSLWPLSDCESQVAEWYANDAIAQIHTPLVSASSTIQTDLALMNEHVSKVYRDVQSVRSNKNARGDIPATLLRLAVMDGHLAAVNLDTPIHVDGLFQQAQQSQVLINGGDNPMWDYQYAAFLNTTYGSKKKNAITAALSRIYTGRSTSTSTINTFFLQSRTTSEKSTVVALAKLDTGFASYLESIGWNKKDL